MNATQQKQSSKGDHDLQERYDTVEPELRPTPAVYIKPSVFTKR